VEWEDKREKSRRIKLLLSQSGIFKGLFQFENGGASLRGRAWGGEMTSGSQLKGGTLFREEQSKRGKLVDAKIY